MIRIINIYQNKLVLKQVLKTHSCSIQLISITPNNKIIAVYGIDNTIFFLKMIMNIIPLGYIELEQHKPVVSLHWSLDNNKLLLAQENIIYEYNCQHLNQYKTKEYNQTYKITLSYRIFKLPINEFFNNLIDDQPIISSILYNINNNDEFIITIKPCKINNNQL